MATYCRSKEQADAEILEWIATSEGKPFPNNWGNQCTAYIQSSVTAILGRPWTETLGYGNAIEHMDNASTKYFDKVWNDPKNADLLPQVGYIAVYRGAAPLWDGRYYGHTFIVRARDKTRQHALQQDGATPPTRVFPDGYSYSVRPAHRASFFYVGDPSVGDVRGWLRFKWKKVVYTGADKRGYGNTHATPTTVASSTLIKYEYPLSSAAYTSPANCPGVFGYARPKTPVSDVIHHWDDPASKPTFDGTLNHLKNQPSNGVSAHWVGQADRVAQMVSEANASHANGHAAANAMTVTHEWNPRCSAEDREALAEHLARRWIARGYSKPGLIEYHSMYFGTACPGRYAQHIKSIQARANALFHAKRSGGSLVAPNIFEEMVHMKNSDVDRVFNEYFYRNRKKAGTFAWTVANNRDRGVNIERRLKGIVQSIFSSRHKRADGSTVTLADVVSYEKSNWVSDRENQKTIIEQNKRIIALLEEGRRP